MILRTYADEWWDGMMKRKVEKLKEQKVLGLVSSWSCDESEQKYEESDLMKKASTIWVIRSRDSGKRKAKMKEGMKNLQLKWVKRLSVDP